jgi:hypothetical protein
MLQQEDWIMFEITRGTGFKVTFENGWTVSVQFGSFNYCDKSSFDLKGIVPEPPKDGFWLSPTAEVAVLKPDGRFARISDCDEVMGWQTPEQVLALMAQVASGTVTEYERQPTKSEMAKELAEEQGIPVVDIKLASDMTPADLTGLPFVPGIGKSAKYK